MPSRPKSTVPSFHAHSQVLVDRVGRGTKAKGIRRPFLLERGSDRILELQTAFLDIEFGLNKLNTQLAVLSDLAFLNEWCSRKRTLDPAWVAPERRAAQDQVVLTQREVKDFARWCQRSATTLALASQIGERGIERFPVGEVVAPSTRNRRLLYAARYLKWMTTSLATDENGTQDSSPTIRSIAIETLLHNEIVAESKQAPIVSLTPTESDALKKVLSDKKVFPLSDIGIRDRQIFELLRQGMRAGEILKIRCNDVVEDFQVDKDKSIAVVAVERRTNDVDDSRTIEPAVKTKEGLLPIPRRVASAIGAYVRGPRRSTMDASGLDETQYLFVNHDGPHRGKPLSQRNLTRIVTKLKGRFDLPEDLHPHSMRHTHFTELAEELHKRGRSSEDIRDLLIQRGRWSESTKMTALYTARFLMNQSADLVEARDREMYAAL